MSATNPQVTGRLSLDGLLEIVSNMFMDRV